MAVTLTEEFFEPRSELRLLVSGSLDTTGASRLVRRVADAFFADIRALVIDLSEVHAIDHDGVKALISLHACAVAAGVAYELRHAPPLLCHVLRLVSLESSQSVSWMSAVSAMKAEPILAAASDPERRP